MRCRSLTLAVAVATFCATHHAAAQATPDTSSDPFLWLEDQHGARSMAWVNAENAKTTAVLERDPHFAGFYRDALKIAEATDRIPSANFIGGALYNFWQDSAHVRGLWRRTTLESYRTPHPQWTTVLDLDSLARVEHANWVWEGVNCALPVQRRCMISLSDGGEDAITAREFDLATRAFVANGFVLPHGKQNFDWLGTDTLLVSREWAKGDVTSSGYPFIVKAVARGEPLDKAAEIFRGTAKDGGYGVSPGVAWDGSGNRVEVIGRTVSTFETELYIVRNGKPSRLGIPLKAGFVALVDNQMVIQLSQPWTTGNGSIAAGSLVSIDAAAAASDPARLTPSVIFQPGPRESVNGVTATKHHLIAAIYQNVRGRVFAFTHAAGKWTRQRLPFPDNLATDIGSADVRSDNAFVGVTGFLTPTSVWEVNAARGTASSLKTSPARFDASHDTVDQFEATSKDGTKVPYFVVHPKGMKLDGTNPTVLNAYGGFEISMTPYYSAGIGKLWLEHGGVFVLANIRGGGEFGPAWHEAGLTTHREVIYDDFAAVGRDLIARQITSTPHLGIMGGSNGGLLMGVEFTEHPDLWGAVDIQIPLLDMLRFEQIDAGESWVGEYGSVSNPVQRAFLASISPYQNLRRGVKYPTPLIWTTTKDDRVGPQHARKFAAKMASFGDPYFFYEVTEGGHGSGANLKEEAHTNALEYTYFASRLMR
ncbi:MAG TPA: prolyl oligopeptidase family serine peptidase [Gemmatimonadales bacterium]